MCRAGASKIEETGWSWDGGGTYLLSAGDDVKGRNQMRNFKESSRSKFRGMTKMIGPLAPSHPRKNA